MRTRFLMSEVPLYGLVSLQELRGGVATLSGVGVGQEVKKSSYDKPRALYMYV